MEINRSAAKYIEQRNLNKCNYWHRHLYEYISMPIFIVVPRSIGLAYTFLVINDVLLITP